MITKDDLKDEKFDDFIVKIYECKFFENWVTPVIRVFLTRKKQFRGKSHNIMEQNYGKKK